VGRLTVVVRRRGNNASSDHLAEKIMEVGTVTRGSIRAGVVTVATLGAVAAAGLSAWAAGYFDSAAPLGDTAVTSEVLVSADGRILTASVSWTGCEDRPTLTADETSSSVALQIKRHRHAPDGAVCDDGQAKQLSVSLKQPLGDRHLNSQGSSVGTFLATNLRQPGYLPAGYTQTTDVGFYVDTHLEHVERSGVTHYVTPRTPSWEQGYAANPNGGRVLFIAQTVGNSAPTRGTSISVNGHPGHFTVLPSTGQQVGETLSWFDGTYTITIQEQDPSLTQAEVLRVAQGLL
jgi:hypothetical protein